MKDHVLLENRVAGKCIAAPTEYVHEFGADHREEALTEGSEVRSRRETARRDKDEVSRRAEQRRTDGHEQAVDIWLTVHDALRS